MGWFLLYLYILLILAATVQNLSHIYLTILVRFLGLLLVLHQQLLYIDIFILLPSARSAHLQLLGVDFLSMLLFPLPDVHIDLIDDNEHQLLRGQPVMSILIYQNSIMLGPFAVNTIVDLLERQFNNRFKFRWELI